MPDDDPITRPRDLATRPVTVPAGGAFILFAVRIMAGFLWLVNGLVKNPWNDWGYFPGWVQRFADNSPIPPYKWFLENVVLTNLDFWGWVQFLLEVGLGVALLAGAFTGAAGLLATAWAANIVVGSAFVPGEWLWGLASFFAVMPLLWLTRAGRYLGLDAVLRPRLAASQRPRNRWIAKWAM